MMPRDYRPLGVAVAVVVLVEVSASVSPPGDAVVVVDCSVVEVVPPPAGEGFTIVVLLSALAPGDAAGDAPGATTFSVRCSHEARRAALAIRQRYFFIV